MPPIIHRHIEQAVDNLAQVTDFKAEIVSGWLSAAVGLCPAKLKEFGICRQSKLRPRKIRRDILLRVFCNPLSANEKTRRIRPGSLDGRCLCVRRTAS